MFLTICLNPTLQKTLCFSSVVSGAVNRTAVHRLDASGKGINVTRVLNQLGKKVIHLTQLGGTMRPLFLSLCEQDKLSVEWVESNSEIRFCYTVINESDNRVTELVEESDAVTAGTGERLLDKYDSLLANPLFFREISSVIISGTKAAGFSDAIIPSMVCKAKEKGLRVILDIKGNDLIESLQYEPDIIKPNLEEFKATYDKKPGKDMLIELARKYKCCIILTNGRRKTLAVEKNDYFELAVPIVKAQNTTGCGDAFTAGLAAALEDGWSAKQPLDFKAAINEAMRIGALSAVNGKPGSII